MKTQLIIADHVLTLDTQDREFQPGYLLIEGGKLAGIGPAGEVDRSEYDDVVDLKGKLVMPGLINAHTHSPMTLFRGLAEGYSLLTFEGWYEGIRVWEEVMTPEMVPPAVEVSCAEMVRTGTTCFVDQYFHMEKIVPVVKRSGLRAVLAYGVVEMGDEETRERELARAAEFLESVDDEPRIKGWVGPHAFFVDNSLAAMESELALAERFDCGFHIHLATGGEEDEYCQKHFGRSAVQQLQVMGMLERPIMAAHSITIPESDLPTLAEHPFTAVIASSACMRSGAAIPSLKSMQEAGVNTALGTDNVANNNSYDLFNEMELTAKLMSLREKETDAIPARTLLEMATAGAARGMGLEKEIGSLAPGKRADLISLDLRDVGWTPESGQSIYTAIVYAVNGSYVCDVMVDGRWLLRDKSWTTMDYASARSELNAASVALQKRREDN